MSKEALEAYMNAPKEALCEMESTKIALLKSLSMPVSNTQCEGNPKNSEQSTAPSSEKTSRAEKAKAEKNSEKAKTKKSSKNNTTQEHATLIENAKVQAKKAEREAIEKRLLSKYENALIKVAHLKTEVERLSEQIELEKAKATIAVCSAKDDTGKPLYTNDKQREAAVVMALAESKDYQLLLANYARNLTDLRLAEADVKVADKAIAFYLKAEVD